MNVMDRSFSASADHAAAQLKATRQRRRNLILGIAAILIVSAAVFYVVWAFTLCGDCGGQVALPPATGLSAFSLSEYGPPPHPAS